MSKIIRNVYRSRCIWVHFPQIFVWRNKLIQTLIKFTTLQLIKQFCVSSYVNLFYIISFVNWYEIKYAHERFIRYIFPVTFLLQFPSIFILVWRSISMIWYFNMVSPFWLISSTSLLYTELPLIFLVITWNRQRRILSDEFSGTFSFGSSSSEFCSLLSSAIRFPISCNVSITERRLRRFAEGFRLFGVRFELNQ